MDRVTLSLIDGTHVSSSIRFRVQIDGMPIVGNRAFAFRPDFDAAALPQSIQADVLVDGGGAAQRDGRRELR
jgi:hypothetical protein